MNSYVDPEGREWVRPSVVLERLPALTRGQIKIWVHRGHITKVRVGKDSWLLWSDVLKQERKTRAK